VSRKKIRKSLFAPSPVPPPASYTQLPYGSAPEAGLPGALDIRVSVLQDHRATVAQAVLTDAARPYNPVVTVTGSSTDQFDEESDLLLAVGEALHNLADKLDKRARRRMIGFKEASGEFTGTFDPVGSGHITVVEVGNVPENVPESVCKMIGRLFPDADVTYAKTGGGKHAKPDGE
jgi:hypothetical protein